MSDADAEAAVAVIGLYERLAQHYIAERSSVAWDESAWLDRFLAQVPPPRRVLDLGCGAGAPIGEYLVKHGCILTGIDSSASLISHCQERFSAGTWQVADMRRLALGQSFQGLLAWDSFFHLTQDDQRKMFGVFRAHAAPGAALLFTSGPHHGVSIGSYHGEPLYHASLDPGEYEALLAEHGFSVLSHVVEDPACGRHTVWLAKHQ